MQGVFCRLAYEHRTSNPEPRTPNPNLEHEPGTWNPARLRAERFGGSAVALAKAETVRSQLMRARGGASTGRWPSGTTVVPGAVNSAASSASWPGCAGPTD